MLERYRRTFWPMQAVMWGLACVIVISTRSLLGGFVALVTMQLAALVGAAWAARLKSRLDGAGYSRGARLG
jgi:hypothetical protein